MQIIPAVFNCVFTKSICIGKPPLTNQTMGSGWKTNLNKHGDTVLIMCCSLHITSGVCCGNMYQKLFLISNSYMDHQS